MKYLYDIARDDRDRRKLDLLVDDAIIHKDKELMRILTENTCMAPASLWKLYKFCFNSYSYVRFSYKQFEYDLIIEGIIGHPNVTPALLRRLWEDPDYRDFEWSIMTTWAKKKRIPDDIISAIIESECDEALSELASNLMVSAEVRALALERIGEIREF